MQSLSCSQSFYLTTWSLLPFHMSTMSSLDLIQNNNRGATLHWGSICVIEGIFTFFQDIWFLYIPFVVMLRDPELGKNFPGKEIVTKFFVEKLCFADIINWNRGSSGGNSRHHDLQEENCWMAKHMKQNVVIDHKYLDTRRYKKYVNVYKNVNTPNIHFHSE